MKANLLILYMTLSISIFGQVITKELLQIESTEKNSKTIIFHKQSVDLLNSFIITAHNKSSNDFTSCKWKVKMNIGNMKLLYEALSEVVLGDNTQITYKKFSIKVKNKKVKVTLLNSICTSEHSTHYFQKSCKRELSFILFPKQINSFVQVFEDVFSPVIVEKY